MKACTALTGSSGPAGTAAPLIATSYCLSATGGRHAAPLGNVVVLDIGLEGRVLDQIS